MADSLLWWLGLTIIGWAAFPFAFLLFRWLPDRGYAFSRVLGLILLSYILWIGGYAHLLPFHRATIIALLVGMAALAVWLVRTRPEIQAFLREKWQYILAVEVLFAAVLGAGLWVRSFTPEIAFGEKLADFAFINGILRSDYFPPNDPWLSGEKINWYYFGHLNVAMLTKLLGIPSRITFNLAAVSTAAMGAIGVFGLVYNLMAGRTGLLRTFAFGFVGVIFFVFLSNIVGVFEMTAVHGIGGKGFYGLLNISGLGGPRPTTEWYPTEWWWIGRAVTIAPRDLREFPFFSFLTGDLHAHMMAIPFNFLGLALLLNLWRSDLQLDGGFWRAQPVRFIVMGIALGAIGFVELWDLPAFLFLLTVVAFAWSYGRQRKLNWAVAKATVGFAAPLAALSIIAFAPFYLGLKSISEGVQPIEVEHLQIGPVSTAVTRPHHYIYAWLPFTWVMLALGLVMVSAKARRGKGAGAAPWRQRLTHWAMVTSLGVVPLLGWAVAVFFKRGPVGFAEELAGRNASWITALILIGLMSMATAAFLRLTTSRTSDSNRRGEMFVLAVSAVAFLLLWGAEIFWIEDPIGTRFNTLFRFGYQAWLFLSVTMPFALYLVLSQWKVRLTSARVAKVAWVSATVIIFAAALVYPLPATFWRTAAFKNPQSLDGLALARHFNPDEDAAISWLDSNVDGNPVVLEGVGDDYRDDQGRVSARTGLQTVLSWPGHQERWRGGRDPFAGRAEAVEALYKTTDVEQAKDILEKYGVGYVYVGVFEREKYGEGGLPKLEGFLEVVYENPSVTIYRVPDGEPGLAAAR